MTFFTKQEVSKMSKTRATRCLRELKKIYNLDKPLSECFEQVWPDLDDIANTLLYLEDHIAALELSENIKAGMARSVQ